MNKRFIAITLCLFFLLWTGCVYLPSLSQEIIHNIKLNEISYNLKAYIPSEVLAYGGSVQITSATISDFFSLLPAFTIKTDKYYKTGGKINLELPVPERLQSLIYSGALNKISLCSFNFSTGRWEKIQTQFDSAKNIYQGIIPFLKEENIDTSKTKIFISLALPTKQGLITDLYQQNKLVKSEQGSLENIFDTTKREKNCIIIHGFTSNIDNMFDLFKTIQSKNYYNNIIYYQYASGDNIKNNAEWLVKKIGQNSKIQFDIIAHSMGGLVARYAIENLGMDKNTDKFIMIGTPNNGGNFTEFASVLFPDVVDALIKSFPGANDLITGSSFYSINKDYKKENIKTKYYCLAGDIGGDRLVKSDIWVSVASATFLPMETELGFERDFTQGQELVTISGWKYYKPSKDKFNMQYEHSNLCIESNSNGIGEQVAEWIREK